MEAVWSKYAQNPLFLFAGGNSEGQECQGAETCDESLKIWLCQDKCRCKYCVSLIKRNNPGPPHFAFLQIGSFDPAIVPVSKGV